jgi:hypothetical protein
VIHAQRHPRGMLTCNELYNFEPTLTNDCFNDADTGQCRTKQGKCTNSGGFCPKSAKGSDCKCIK